MISQIYMPSRLLCRGVKHPQRVSCNDINQSNSDSLVMLEILGMWSTWSLPLHPGPLWPGVLAPERVLSMGQIELLDI